MSETIDKTNIIAEIDKKIAEYKAQLELLETLRAAVVKNKEWLGVKG